MKDLKKQSDLGIVCAVCLGLFLQAISVQNLKNIYLYCFSEIQCYISLPHSGLQLLIWIEKSGKFLPLITYILNSLPTCVVC